MAARRWGNAVRKDETKMVARKFGTLEGGQTEGDRDDSLLANEMREGKVFRAVVTVMTAELNILRQAASLQPRTAQQVRTALKNAMRNGA